MSYCSDLENNTFQDQSNLICNIDSFLPMNISILSFKRVKAEFNIKYVKLLDGKIYV